MMPQIAFVSSLSRRLLLLLRLLLVVGVLLSSSVNFVVHASVPVPDAEGVTTTNEGRSAAAAAAPQYTYKFVHKTVIIPHDEKKFRGGEDSASTSDRILVVADGVGGWANQGVNPGHFSRLLTHTIVQQYDEDEQQKTKKIDDANADEYDDNYLKQLVHNANHYTAAQHLGSATCTVVRLLNNSTTLETLNIGDSGYSIHRRRRSNAGEDTKEEEDNTLESLWEVAYESDSDAGQKGFNFPYQLGGPKHGDVVADVANGPYRHELQPNDVILVVTDGVNDNLPARDYHHCLGTYTDTTVAKQEKNQVISYSVVADCIAKKAYHLGKDHHYHSPFAQSAAKYGKRFAGGKHDDITVTVAQVVVANSAEEEDTEFDPYFTNSIQIYTDKDGPIGQHAELPTKQFLLQQKQDKMDGITGRGSEL